MPSLTDLPVEVLIDHLLQSMPIQDLLSLGATSKARIQRVPSDLQSLINITLVLRFVM